MRSFSSEEKIYLKQIVDAYTSDDWEKMKLSNLILSIFDREIDFEGIFPYIQLKDGESGSDKDVVGYTNAIKEAYIPISNFNSLLFYLHSNHLIYIVPYFNLKQSLLETYNEDETEICNNFFMIESNSYLEFLKSNLSDFICPTQELIDFVSDKFITKHDKQFKTTTNLSKWGIGIAIVFGIIGFVFSVIGFFYNKTPDISNKFNPHVIITTKNDVDSGTQKPNTIDSLRMNSTENKLKIKK